jgi:hypothetical protein
MGPDGSPLTQGSVPHSARGLAGLVRALLPLANNDPAAIAIAAQTDHGPVVETCLAYSFAVFSTNPKQLDRFRDRFAPAGSKSDELDARVLADSLRTDVHLFRAVELSDERPDSFPGLTRLQARTVATVLRDRRVRRVSPEAAVEALRRPSLIRAPGAPEAAWEQVRYLLPQLRLIHQQARDCEKLVTETLKVLCANDSDE